MAAGRRTGPHRSLVLLGPAVSRAISAPSRRCVHVSSKSRSTGGGPLRRACRARPGLAAEASDRRGKGGRVVRSDQQAAHLVGDDVGDAAHARRDHRRPERHRLHEHERRHLARREQQRVRGQQAGSDVGGRPREVDLPREVEDARLSAELGGVGAIGLEPEDASAGPRARGRAAPGRPRSRRPGACGGPWCRPARAGPDRRRTASRGPGSGGTAMPTGFSRTLAHAPSKACAIHGEIATTVCASAPCTRNSRLAAADFGASWACTMTGTPASRAPMTGATSTVLLTMTTSIRCRRTSPANRTASGMVRPIWSAHRPRDAPQIGRRSDRGRAPRRPRRTRRAAGRRRPRSRGRTRDAAHAPDRVRPAVRLRARRCARP